MGSYLPSLIGYQTIALANPVTGPRAVAASGAFGSVSSPAGYGPSLIGYATSTLADPLNGRAPAVSGAFGSIGSLYGPSLIGYQSATLVDPGGGSGGARGPSQVGFVTATLAAPHQPVTVMTATNTTKKCRILTWDGTNLR